ncbi:MAG TPA: methyltransferase domain-containing protein [Mycobacteriales bacterium]|nr:methyltransferase domain-containing protein [Mycobacteriales bacterium]
MPGRRPPQRRQRSRGPEADRGRIRLFATAVPGIAPLLQRELSGLRISTDATGFDGRADIVSFEIPGRDIPELGTAEDLFIEVGRTLRSEGDRPQWISRRLWKPARVDQALALRPARAQTTFRVIARVLQERSFKRTELRRHLTGLISTDRPRWRPDDPAAVEIWAVEYTAGKFLAGLRVSDAAMRQHDGRAVERTGALRPTVAAAMLNLLSDQDRFTLLDPCCGSGTILSEAISRGWNAIGRDIDPEAVAISRQNARAAKIERGDVHRLDLPSASVDGCVSNLPFGQQYELAGDPAAWLRSALVEMARVTRSPGRVVLLSPTLPRASVPEELRLVQRHPIRLLGTRTTIWTLDRS